ncbi:hypothetical protein [Stenotrophomonas sp. G106K1]
MVVAVAATLAAGAAASTDTTPPDEPETVAELQQGRVGYGD